MKDALRIYILKAPLISLGYIYSDNSLFIQATFLLFLTIVATNIHLFL